MPQHASAKRRLRSNAKRQARNNYVKSTLRTLSKRIESDIPAEEKRTLLDQIYSQLDKAAKKGVIHKRTASRRKARVAAYVNSHLEKPE